MFFVSSLEIGSKSEILILYTYLITYFSILKYPNLFDTVRIRGRMIIQFSEIKINQSHVSTGSSNKNQSKTLFSEKKKSKSIKIMILIRVINKIQSKSYDPWSKFCPLMISWLVKKSLQVRENLSRSDINTALRNITFWDQLKPF